MSFILYNAPAIDLQSARPIRAERQGAALRRRSSICSRAISSNPDTCAQSEWVVPTLRPRRRDRDRFLVIIEYLDEIAPASENFSPRDPQGVRTCGR